MLEKLTNLATAAAMLAATVGGAACAGNNPVDPPTPVWAPNGRSVVVEVESRHWKHVKVYLRAGAGRLRLGEVEPFSKARFTIPEGVAGRTVQIELRPFGSTRRFTTESVRLGGAKALSLIVSSDVWKSVLTAW